MSRYERPPVYAWAAWYCMNQRTGTPGRYSNKHLWVNNDGITMRDVWNGKVFPVAVCGVRLPRNVAEWDGWIPGDRCPRCAKIAENRKLEIEHGS